MAYEAEIGPNDMVTCLDRQRKELGCWTFDQLLQLQSERDRYKAALEKIATMPLDDWPSQVLKVAQQALREDKS